MLRKQNWSGFFSHYIRAPVIKFYFFLNYVIGLNGSSVCLENSMDKGAWQATLHGLQRVEHDWAMNTKTQHLPKAEVGVWLTLSNKSRLFKIFIITNATVFKYINLWLHCLLFSENRFLEVELLVQRAEHFQDCIYIVKLISEKLF